MVSTRRLEIQHGSPRISLLLGVLFGLSFLATVGFVARFGSTVPFMDDLDMIGRLSRPGSIDAEWFWSQHVVHRIPLPRALYLGIVAITRDVRSLMFLDVLLLGAVSLAMIVAARRIRGRSSLSDVFFVLIWLHWGNDLNLLFPFSVTFLLPTVLSCVVLLVLVTQSQPLGRRPAFVIGLCTLALPLCGGPGVTQAPVLALWLAAVGWRASRSEDGGQRCAGRVLLGFGVATVSLIALYFVGFRMGQESADPLTALKTAAKFTSLGLGSVAKPSWPWSGVFVFGFLLIGVLVLLGRLRDRSPDRRRALGLLCYFAATACMALAIGLRGEAWSAGFALRYITLPAPAMCAAYFVLLLYARRRNGSLLCAAACLVFVAALPFNVDQGLAGAEARRRQLDDLAADAQAGLSLEELAARHWEGLYPTEEHFRDRLEALREAGFAPFEKR